MKKTASVPQKALAVKSRSKRIVQSYIAYPLTDLASENFAKLHGNIGGTEENIGEYLLPGHKEKKKSYKLGDRQAADRLSRSGNEFQVFALYTDGSIARYRSEKNKQINRTRKAKRALQKTKI